MVPAALARACLGSAQRLQWRRGRAGGRWRVRVLPALCRRVSGHPLPLYTYISGVVLGRPRQRPLGSVWVSVGAAAWRAERGAGGPAREEERAMPALLVAAGGRGWG